MKRLLEAIAKFERRFFVVGILAFLMGAAGLYYTVREQRTELTYDLTGEINALDVRATVPDLTIRFRDQDLASSGQNLRIITMRVANTGETNILQGQYDQGDIWGFELTSGTVIQEPRVLDGSSQYVEGALGPKLVTPRIVAFNKIILDRGAYVIVEVRVLHPQNAVPDIRPLGKIAGMDSIVLSRSWRGATQTGPLQRAYNGAWDAQLLRVFGYSVAGLLTLMAIVAIFAVPTTIMDSRRKRARTKRLKPVVHALLPEGGKLVELFVRTYAEDGFRGLEGIAKSLAEPETIPKNVFSEHKAMSTLEGMSPFIEHDFRRLHLQQVMDADYYSLIKAGAIRQGRSGETEVDETAKAVVQRLLAILAVDEKTSASALKAGDSRSVTSEQRSEASGQSRATNTQTPGKTDHHEGPAGEAGQQARQP